MVNKWRNLVLLIAGGIAFSVLATGIMYRFFPQYLCYAVYGVSESSLDQAEEAGMASGTRLTERFVPRYRYLTGVNIGVRREETDDVIIGRLLDGQGKVMAESRFALSDTEYIFPFHKWVEPGQQYQLEILFPEDNQNEVMVTFGSEVSGAEEHVMSYMEGEPLDRVLYICYIYGTYSRKLLAFWFIVLFTGGFMIGETILSRLASRNSNAE